MNNIFEMKPSWSMINHEKLCKSYGILNYYVVEPASDSDSDKYKNEFSQDEFSDDDEKKELDILIDKFKKSKTKRDEIILNEDNVSEIIKNLLK